MIDFARITISAGKGGDGTGSFVHIKGKRRGKADGGDGGRGGNIFFVATGNVNTLEAFRYSKEYKAQSGERGLSNRRRGAEGADLEIKVPIGTQITLGEEVLDLIESNQRVMAARGGEGGRGNSHLRDEFGRRPLSGEKGEEGESFEVKLELKLIADVGLIGLPNAGKSTLIAALTAARPKIADYPFTTLEPNLGVLEINGKKVVLADIPGLIEGASEGKGLGDLFLKHIERTKVLVHLIDISQGDDLWDVYQKIRSELKAYSKELVKKREIVVINKLDLVDQSVSDEIIASFKARRKRVLAISAAKKIGLEALVAEIKGLVKG